MNICNVYGIVMYDICNCTTGIYGGAMLGVRTPSGLAFYDWDNTELVRRIEIAPKQVSY